VSCLQMAVSASTAGSWHENKANSLNSRQRQDFRAAPCQSAPLSPFHRTQELANLCADKLGELAESAEDGLERINDDVSLYFVSSATPAADYGPTPAGNYKSLP
jgi:hypothetical protein